MRINTLGVGSSYCRFPLYPSCFSVNVDEQLIVIDCSFRTLDTLERFNKKLCEVDVWVITGLFLNQIGGLEEVALKSKYEYGKKPTLVVPLKIRDALQDLLIPLLTESSRRFGDTNPGLSLSDYFSVHASNQITIKEDTGLKETITLIPHSNKENHRSYGVSFENAEVFITGQGAYSPKWLRYYANESKVILRGINSDHPDWARDLVSYMAEMSDLNDRTWFYGYDKQISKMKIENISLIEQNAWIYDSRKDFPWIRKKGASKKPLSKNKEYIPIPTRERGRVLHGQTVR